MPSSPSWSALGSDRPKRLYPARRACRQWPKAGTKDMRAEDPGAQSLGARCRKWLAWREDVDAQTFFELGVAFGVRFGIEFRIGGLSLLGAVIHSLPILHGRLAELSCPRADSRHRERSQDRESEQLHPAPPLRVGSANG